jgi:hypothetical protein
MRRPPGKGASRYSSPCRWWASGTKRVNTEQHAFEHLPFLLLEVLSENRLELRHGGYQPNMGSVVREPVPRSVRRAGSARVGLLAFLYQIGRAHV